MALRIRETSRPNEDFQLTYQITINDDQIIYITVTPTAIVVQQWMRQAIQFQFESPNADRLIVGISIQVSTTAVGRQGRSSSEMPASTLQLCVGQRCLIYQLNQSPGSPTILNRFFNEYPHITFVSFIATQDFNLRLFVNSPNHRLGFLPSMPIDLRSHVASYLQWPPEQATVGAIAQSFLGPRFHLDWHAGNTDWEVQRLSTAQVSYAAVMAFLPSIVGVHIEAWGLNPFHQDDDDNDNDTIRTDDSSDDSSSDDSSSDDDILRALSSLFNDIL